MPYYYKNPNQPRESGPFEERVIIARMIDGEINSRTMVRVSTATDFHTIGDSDFGAVLENLTARWRHNIVALKFESLWFYLSLLFTAAVAVAYSVMAFLRPEEFAVFEVFRSAAGLFLVGLLASNYFLWLYAYRMWRVVPKSRYRVSPGWRIMLTYIPLFRFGWNFCMWPTLSTRLRELTNYSCYAGRCAAIFYSVCCAVSAIAGYALVILPWPWEVFSAPRGGYHFLLGGLFWGVYLLALGMRLVSMLVMLEQQKAAALQILRRRYAYNVPMREVKSPFMSQILLRQRRSDRKHRWGHGVGIGGTLIGWPLLLIGIPVLVLSIVGSCSYESTLAEMKTDRYSDGRNAATDVVGAITGDVNHAFQELDWSRAETFCAGTGLREKVSNYALMKSPAGYFIMTSVNKRLLRLGAAARSGKKELYEAERARQTADGEIPAYLRKALDTLDAFVR